MTWQRAGLAAGIAVGLTLVETAPHAATMIMACIAFYVISRALAGRAVLADGTPITWQSGTPVAAVLLGLVLVKTWPHAATLLIGCAVIRTVCARLDSSA
ncbi:MAG: hypothetical protein OXG04_06845 [Acidobacteria bacterium]|nr:hypothetical protein [Acidobacteriota bacterium]